MKGSNGPIKQPSIPRFDSKYGPKVNTHTENHNMEFLKNEIKKRKKKK